MASEGVSKGDTPKPPKTLSFPALGRIARLGDLYNATTDTFIPGVNLFSAPLKLDDGDFEELELNSMDMRYSPTNTLKEKFDLLDVKGEIQLSVMTNVGTFRIGGSASYLCDDKESYNEEHLTLFTKAVTKYQHIKEITQLIYKMNAEVINKGRLSPYKPYKLPLGEEGFFARGP